MHLVVGSSNADPLGDESGGTAVFVDSGAPLEPLVEAVAREGLTPTDLLVTHGHADHVAGNDELVERYGLEVTTGAVETGGLRVEVLWLLPGTDHGVSFVVGGLCFTGDTLFRDAVGGGIADQVRASVMDVLMQLPAEHAPPPGDTGGDDRRGVSGTGNPFVRYWRGEDGEDGRACSVNSEGRDGGRLVAGLRRQGQGARPLRGRRRGHRRRVAHPGPLALLIPRWRCWRLLPQGDCHPSVPGRRGRVEQYAEPSKQQRHSPAAAAAAAPAEKKTIDSKTPRRKFVARGLQLALHFRSHLLHALNRLAKRSFALLNKACVSPAVCS